MRSGASQAAAYGFQASQSDALCQVIPLSVLDV